MTVKWPSLSCAALSLLLWQIPAAARVVHVPGDVLTIQAGLDDLTDGDTVQVARGRYAELLIGPPLSFVMIGEFEPDSGEAARPFVYATGLPGADTTGVFHLARFSRVVIENMKFQNGPLPDSSLWYRRGIRSWADRVTLRNCIVDSTCTGFRQEQDSIGAVITLDDCQFRGNLSRCVFSRTNNVIHARNCLFTSLGTWGTTLATCLDSSTYVNCTFRGLQIRAALSVFGQGFVVDNCVFGPCQTTAFQPVIETSEIGGRFVNNQFQDCVYGSCVLYLRPDPQAPVEVRGNIFERCRGMGPQAFGVINVLAETDADTGSYALIADNVFTGNSGTVGSNDLFLYYSKALIYNNRFERDTANGLPAVRMDTAWTWWLGDSVLLRDNLFSDCGYAAFGCTFMDARHNWWGDATGPYHESLNSHATGDTIVGSLQFIPWYVDTSFAAVRERRSLLPNDLQLSVFPNPFNSIVSIELAFSPKTGPVELAIYDLLGRAVMRKSFSASPVHFEWDAAAFGSGTYYVEARTDAFHHVRRMALLK